MASWVLSECGLKPFPRVYTRCRNQLQSKTTFSSKIRLLPNRKSHSLGSSLKQFRGTSWALNVSVPLRVTSSEEDEETNERVIGVEDDGEFNPGSPPPFKLADIRAAIPKHCWVKDPWKSMSYVLRDVVVVFGLAAIAAYFNNWIVWPLYWIAQGTMFWALFVLGHDW
jgi:omega-3 fatty acid desaturase (delta-15 desaturase)